MRDDMEDDSSLLNITPTANELVNPERIKCIIADCASTFQNNSNMKFHLQKHHRLNVSSAIDPTTKVRYFCPEPNCKYNVAINNGKMAMFFASRKYLRQHFLKMHAIKKFDCDQCTKKFASAALHHQHAKMCGNVFKCDVCGWTYSSRECLMTHCRRKGHAFPDSLGSGRAARIVRDQGAVRTPLKSRWRLIAPNIKEEASLAIRSGDTLAMGKVTQTTQTAAISTSERATVEQHTTKQPSQSQQTPLAVVVKPNDKYKNLDLIDEESSTMISNASQSYRNLNNLNYLEEESAMAYFDNALNAGLCSIETQTPFPYSHMYTQTGDVLLSDLGFANIETQTNWAEDYNIYNEISVSTETQTCFPQQIIVDNNISTQTQTTNSQSTQCQQTDSGTGS